MTKSDFKKLYDQKRMEFINSVSSDAIKQYLEESADSDGHIPTDELFANAVSLSLEMCMDFVCELLTEVFEQ